MDRNSHNVRPFAHKKYGHPMKDQRQDFTALAYLEVRLDSYVMFNLALLERVPLKYVEEEMR